MHRPKVSVFDLGKVLLDFDYSIVARKMAPHCTVPEDDVLQGLNQSSLLHRYETGLISTSDFFSEVCRLSTFCREFAIFEPIFADIFTPIPEMIEFSHSLRKRGVPTYIFSNTNEIAIKHIRAAYPFYNDFNGHILSYEQGAMKPDAKIYVAVEHLTRASGPDILYIDDRLENVEQGAARNWQTIHHHSSEETVRKAKQLFVE